MTQTIDVNFNQLFLLPPSLDDFLPEDDPARFIREFVDSLDFKQLGIKLRKSRIGAPDYSKKLLLRLWLYGSYEKITSSRKLEKACKRDIALIWLSGMNYPDHNTLWRFFKENKEPIKNIFKQSAIVALDNNLVGLVMNAIDGTKMEANVSGENALHEKKLEKVLKKVDEYIEQLSKEVELHNNIDENNENIDTRLPSDLQDSKKLKENIQKSLEKLKEFETSHLSETDQDSRMMKGRKGTTLSYNCQAVVDDKEGIIVGSDVLQDENDTRALTHMIDNVKQNLGKIADENTADGGYFSGEELNKSEEKNYNVLVNISQKSGKNKSIDTNSEFHQHNFTYDEESDTFICTKGGKLYFEREKRRNGNKNVNRLYRCKNKECPFKGQCTKDKRGRSIEVNQYIKSINRQKEKLKDEKKKEILKKRMWTVEPIFGFIKENLGFRKFTVRGLENVKVQWSFVCTIVNLRKIYKHWKGGVINF